MRTLEQLREENDVLRERIVQLEELLGTRYGDLIDYIASLGLTRTEARLFSLLMKRPIVSHDMAITALWGNRENNISSHMVPTLVHKIRKKVLPHGIAVTTQWANGYVITSDMKDKVRQHVQAWIDGGRHPSRVIHRHTNQPHAILNDELEHQTKDRLT